LIEVGFEFVNQIGTVYLYRKRARFNNLAGSVGFEPTTINSAG
jgi:virulence-associated protein VapD